MSAHGRKYLAVIAVLLVASVLVLRIQQARGKISSQVEFEKLPLSLGEWQGRDMEVTEDIYEVLETRDVLIREYKDKDGDSIDLAVVYSGEERHSFHPPELCFLGGGVELLDRKREEIGLGDDGSLAVNKLIMKSGQGKMVSWYWFSAGERFTPNYYLQQAYLALDAFRGSKVKGALIRIAASGHTPNLENKAQSFIRQALPYLKEIL